jgi:hypothetical protein
MSKLFSLNSSDFLKGLLLAVLTSVITIVYSSLQSGSLTFDYKLIGTTALSSALAYIMKNLVTNSSGEILKSEK